MTQRLLDETVEREVRELRRRVARYRVGYPTDVRGRTVIVVDDGLATGLTAQAAVDALRARGAARIVVGVPVGARESVALLEEAADEVVCEMTPADFGGVGRWYRDFSPVSDEEVVALLTAASTSSSPAAESTDPQATPAPRVLRLDVGGTPLAGDLTRPADARGLVIFAHGSGSSRLSPRNRAVASALNDAGLATLLFDLLTEHEASRRELVFDVALLARRLASVTAWAREDPSVRRLAVGYFGASTGAAAALLAAATEQHRVSAVVSRGGRPDLVADRLGEVSAPTLLLVGADDPEVLALNRRAAARLRCPHRLTVVPGAGHLFEEPGALETVARLSSDWFSEHLERAATRSVAEVG